MHRSKDRSLIDYYPNDGRLASGDWIRPSTWVISDLHIGHNNIVDYCNRPADHEQLIEENWRRLVSEDDDIIVLGDVAVNSEKGAEFLSRMPGRIHLVYGNHDKPNAPFWQAAGAITVTRGMEFYYSGIRVLLSHRPDRQRTFTEPYYRRNIHGHVHQHSIQTMRSYRGQKLPVYVNACVEAIGYQPRPMWWMLA